MQLFKATDYLKIDIASNYGHDKQSWDYRINWFNEHEHELLDLMNQADKPAMYYAGICAWQDHKNNHPSGYGIGLDACSSNLQILSALCGDYKAMHLCNVVSTGNREDAYTFIYKTMLNVLNQETELKRDDVKQAIMTSLFGSTAIPKQVFGDGILLETFYKVMEEYAPEVWELNKICLAIWDNERLSYDWVLPDNFHVHIKIMDTVYDTVKVMEQEYSIASIVNKPIEEGKSLSANITHS